MILSRRRPLAVVLILCLAPVLAWSALYFPPKGAWDHRAPAAVSLDPVKLQAAIDFAIAHQNPGPRDTALDLKQTFGAREPLWRLLGPVGERGGMTGLVIRHGYVVAQWGEPDRVDITNSVTKTFLTTVVGLAWQRGLIKDLTDHPKDVPSLSGLFESPHNAAITWEHLLRQTSDWSGTLWDVPDWADRPVGASPADHPNRPMHEPGAFFKYNDVRVNLLALAALHVWQRPLPDVLREEVMDPIGASDTWRWHGYDNSWVEINGRRIQSVSGGGHFGGGMFINTWDLARFGYLVLRGGDWGARPVVSPEWIALARSPGPANPEYGFANWFLNTGRKPLPHTPSTSVTFRGNGENIVYIDWQNDLVVVVRWIDSKSLDEFLGLVLGSIYEVARY